MAVTNEYADGLYKLGWDGRWINFNDTEDCYRRNWNNSEWDKGSAENGIVFRRNPYNTGWVQIYPKGMIYVTPPEYVTPGTQMYTKQRAYSSWNGGYARQGWVVKSGGGGEQFGLILTTKEFTGAGSITKVSGATFSGFLGSSGNYNNIQTITFRGTNHSSASGDPFGSHDPNTPFTFSWDASGPESEIPRGNIGGSFDAIKRWMNNEYRNLCVYNGETNGEGSYESTYSANYLNIKRFNLQITQYTYLARTLIFDRPENRAKMFGFNAAAKPPQDENYLRIIVPESMDVDSVDHAIDLLESGEVEYGLEDSVCPLSDCDAKPTIMRVNEDERIIRVSHIHKEGISVQYRFENSEKWSECICMSPLIYSYPMGAKYIRLIDTLEGTVYSDWVLK